MRAAAGRAKCEPARDKYKSRAKLNIGWQQVRRAEGSLVLLMTLRLFERGSAKGSQSCDFALPVKVNCPVHPSTRTIRCIRWLDYGAVNQQTLSRSTCLHKSRGPPLIDLNVFSERQATEWQAILTP